MKTELTTLCDQLLIAALNSVVAGAFLVGLTGFVLWSLRGVNATTRHAVWFGTLLLLAALLPAHWWRARVALEARAPGEQMESSESVTSAPPAPGPESSGRQPASHAGDVPEMEAGPFWAAAREQVADGRNATSGPATEPLLGEGLWDWELGSARPRSAGLLLVGVWIVVAGIRLVMLGWRFVAVRRLKRSALPASSELDLLFRRLRAELAVKRDVELRVAHAYSSALVLGFLHPVILFPAEEGQDMEEADQVLRHELAHVRRRDDWLNLLQQFLQAVLCFHPAVWWVAKRLALEREIACDDFVLQQGGKPKRYALLLVNLAGRTQGNQRMLAPAVLPGKYQLQQRIDMILNANRNRSPRLAKARLGVITTASTMMALLALVSGPRLVLAEATTSTASSGSAESTGSHSADGVTQPVVVAVTRSPVTAEVAVTTSSDDSASVTVESGPKYKTPESVDAVPELAPSPAGPPKRARSATGPRPARAPRAANTDASIEDRLAKLERMVESLVEQQKSKRVFVTPPGTGYGRMDNIPHGLYAPDMEELKGEIRRETERAIELQKRALKEVEKARKQELPAFEFKMQEGLQQQLRALEHQREALQRDMERLQRQIERLQRQQEEKADDKKRQDLQDH